MRLYARSDKGSRIYPAAARLAPSFFTLLVFGALTAVDAFPRQGMYADLEQMSRQRTCQTSGVRGLHLSVLGQGRQRGLRQRLQFGHSEHTSVLGIMSSTEQLYCCAQVMQDLVRLLSRTHAVRTPRAEVIQDTSHAEHVFPSAFRL
ncbi:hypothetical protein V8E36_007429 [Tilletia maclaganii]